MKLPRQKLSALVRALETVSEYTGRLLAWAVIGLTLIVVYDVSMRYLFREGSVALQELEWHLFALIFLLGAAYTFKHDSHVRVEIIYQKLKPGGRAAINLAGNLLFLLPLCLLLIKSAWPFVHNAYVYGEGSPDPGGLPYRYLIKAAIPTGFLLLILQTVADSIRNLLIFVDKRDGGD